MLPGVSINLSCLHTDTDENRNSCPSFLKITTFLLASLYQKYSLKPALLFSAFWMQKYNEKKHKIMLLAEADLQIQDIPGSTSDSSFSW